MPLDSLQVYFGAPLVINERIKVRQALLGEIIDLSEDAYYGVVQTFTDLPSDHMSFLYDNGVNYMELEDFDFFAARVRTLPQESTQTLFGDIDFTKLKMGVRNNTQKVLFDHDQQIVIDETIYQQISAFLCRTHLLKKQRRRAGNKRTYEAQINADRVERKLAAVKKKESQIQNLISAMVNNPAFKYDLKSVRELTLYQFMDSVKRISTWYSCEHFAQGYYTGNIDPKKVDIGKNLNWLKDLQE